MQPKISYLQRELLVRILFWTHWEEDGINRCTDADRALHRKEELENIGVEYQPRVWLAHHRVLCPAPTSASLSRAISRLEERGLVARRNWFDQKQQIEGLRPARTTHILLTAEGRATAEELTPKKGKRLT